VEHAQKRFEISDDAPPVSRTRNLTSSVLLFRMDASLSVLFRKDALKAPVTT
jgi:hypothetical protein